MTICHFKVYKSITKTRFEIFLPKIKSTVIFAIAMPRVFMDKFSFFILEN